MLNFLKGLSAAVAALLLTFSAAAQVLEKFELGDACNYFGEETPSHVHTFASSKEAEDVIMQIVETIGLPQNFDIVSAGVPNAAAVIRGDKRFILYSRYFMNSVQKEAGNRWAPISIMAHEIGHHLSGHTLGADGSRPRTELEADRFSGSVLQKMGASLEDTLAAMEKLGNEHGSATHPRKLDRLEAITAGWEDSCARDKNCQSERSARADKPRQPEPRAPQSQNIPFSEEEFKQQWKNDDPQFVELLASSGADANQWIADGVHFSFIAIESDNSRILHAMLDRGLDPNLVDSHGESLLIRASLRGHLGAVKILIKKGASLDAGSSEQKITALMAAAIGNHPGVVKELLSRGANPNIADSTGRTARDYAKAFSDISGILRRAGGVCAIRICL